MFQGSLLASKLFFDNRKVFKALCHLLFGQLPFLSIYVIIIIYVVATNLIECMYSFYLFY